MVKMRRGCEGSVSLCISLSFSFSLYLSPEWILITLGDLMNLGEQFLETCKPGDLFQTDNFFQLWLVGNLPFLAPWGLTHSSLFRNIIPEGKHVHPPNIFLKYPMNVLILRFSICGGVNYFYKNTLGHIEGNCGGVKIVDSNNTYPHWG